jgi:hypothetical protein
MGKEDACIHCVLNMMDGDVDISFSNNDEWSGGEIIV